MNEQGSEEILESLKLAQEKILKEQIENSFKLSEKAHDYERRLKSVKLATILASLIGAVVAMVAVTDQFFGWDSNRSRLTRGALSFFDPSKFALAEDVDGLRASVSKADEMLAAAMKNIESPISDNAAQTFELAGLKANIKSIDDRLAVLERSISDNPEKALSIPMLRKDQENMAKAIEGNKIAISSELTRIYDQQKWMLGGIGTVLFAAVTALLSALFKMVFKAKEE